MRYAEPFASWAIAYLLNSIWQLPLIYAAGWFAARLLRPLGPRLEHRAWVAALVSGVVLPACSFDSSTWLALSDLPHQIRLWLASGSAPSAAQVRVILNSGTAVRAGALHLPAAWLMAVLIVYGCGLLFFAIRLCRALLQTASMRRAAQPVSIDFTPYFSGNRQGIDTSQIAVAVSPALSSPVTVGFRHRSLLFPSGFLEDVSGCDLETVLAHELAHMQRHDFAKNLFYGLISLPIAWHPAQWLIAAGIAETREMICDEMAGAVTGRESYARSLLRLASMLSGRTPVNTLHAIGIFDANIFERRVMSLTHNRPAIAAPKRLLIASICAVVALTACASALAFRMDVNTPKSENPPPKSIAVKSDNLKLVQRVNPAYPPEAKKARIFGAVLLDVVIGKDGQPESIRVAKGPHELQESAIDAVRQWRWQPYLLNGEPIEVNTTITVVYTLAG